MSKHRHDSESPKDKTVTPGSAQTQPEAAASQQAQNSQATADQTAGCHGQAGSAGQFAGSSDQPGIAGELETALKENAALKSEVDELNAKYLRKLAEEVNFRKRMLREKEDGQKYALSSLLSDLIPVLDDFDRGMKAAAAAHSFEQLHEGMVLVQRQLSQMLENKYALKRFESAGSLFDPSMHEALFAEPADVEEAVVSEEYLPGYMHHDRVLRSAKVRVKVPNGTKKAAAQEAAAGTEPGTGPEAGPSSGNGDGRN